MGLPTFFRWISERYPKCTTDAVKADPDENLVKANPNDEVDNLYIDINDILHISFHPEESKSPQSFEQCMSNFTNQIEDIVRIARPRQLLYIAFDGVAPKAKLNLQRKRRFEKYQSSTLTKKRVKHLQIYREEAGLEPGELPKERWNSNCLSPGTQFMFDASNYLSNWIQTKQLQDSFWTGLHVILSDSSTPGEGEHKIMQHIRRMRKEPGYKTNTRHVVVGRDADLILLALSTHEPNFRILRQVCHYGKMLKCPMCFRHGHCRDCVYPPTELPERPEHDFIFFDINIFRQCFAQDIMLVQPDIDVENVVNDFVLITFFLGNDFLPKIPGLSIRSGALELLIETYKTHLMVNKQYLTTEKGEPCALALRDFLMLVSNREADLITQEFRINRRCIKALKKKGAIHAKNKAGMYDKEHEGSDAPSESSNRESEDPEAEDARGENAEKAAEDIEEKAAEANEEEVESGKDVDDLRGMSQTEIRQFLVRLDELFPLASFENTSVPWFNGLTLVQQLRYLDLTMYVVPPRMRDSQLKIPYGMHWKRTYYNARFGIKLPKSVAKTKSYVQNGEIRKVLNEYMRGFLWCWKYYTSENPDWEWFYPHHYGPCMSDLTRCILKDVHFPENSKPLNPLVYLMSLLPVSDSQFVPPSFRSLITSDDSPIQDFYPTKCVIDYSEAYVFWQGVCQLPFIDFNRMKSVTDPLVATLPQEYQHLSRATKARVFVVSVMDLGATLLEFYGEENCQPVEKLDLRSVNCREEMTDDSIELGEDEEFSTSCTVVYPIKGLVPLSSTDHSFKSLVAYIKPLEKETFNMCLLPGCVISTPDVLANSAGIAMINNYRRFGTLRKIWYKALQDQRSRMVKETKVLGYFSPDVEEPSMFEKKDPAKNRRNKAESSYDRMGAQAFHQNSYNSVGRGGRSMGPSDRNSPAGSQIEQMLKSMVQQKLQSMMSQPNPNMPELISMMQSYVSLQMNSRSSSPGPQMGSNSSPSVQTMMQQMQLLNMMQNAMGVNQKPQNQQMMGGMHNQGSMQGMQGNPGMMKNFGGFNQMNMQNSPIMSGMSNPLANMMNNQSFNQMGGGSGMSPSPTLMMQQNGMSGGGMGAGPGGGMGAGPGFNAPGGMNMQRMMASMNQMQEEMNQQAMNQQGFAEGEIQEPGAAAPAENAYDPNSFNQRFQTPNNGFNQMGAMGSTPPPQQANNFSNYQSVMKQILTPDGTTPNFNTPPDGHPAPPFSPQQNQQNHFNFAPMNSFQNAGFNQTPHSPHSPNGPYGASPTSGGTPGGTPTGLNQNMWPMTPNTPTGATGGFPNPMSQFVQQHGGSANFNKMSPHQFNRNYGMNNTNNYY